MARFRTPEGVTVNVDDALADKIGGKWRPLDGDANSTPDKSWKVDELTAYASERGIDLGNATKKDDILAVIVADKPAG
jgi:hypothetical protein